MAATMAVSVLTPHGRRQSVKVNANTLMLQILEEVCNKHDLNPDEYDLKFQHRVLRSSERVRYSNLPNNAKLEMVVASHPRSSTEHQVRIALQLPDGVRVQDMFTPRHKLWDVIIHFPQSRVLCVQTQDVVPACVYMQNEYVGEDVLKKTTLKILGLIGGSAAIRFIQIKAPVLEIAADASSRDSAIPKATMQEPCDKVTNVATMPADNLSDAMEFCSDDGSQFSGGTSNTEVPLQAQMGTSFVPFSGSGRSLVELVKTAQTESSCAGGSLPAMSFTSTVSPSSSKPRARQAMVISPDLGPLRSPSDVGGLPDEFFEVTVDDVRKRYSELKKARIHLEEAPLLTSDMRERQKHERLKRYSQVAVRVNFPDRFVLQGFFGPQETVRDLQEFVETHLEDPGLPFYLYTAPPRQLMIDTSQTLYEANLLPAAVVHFGSAVKTEHYLSSTFLRMAVPRLQADMLVESSIPRVLCKSEALDSAVESTNEPEGSGIALPSVQDDPAMIDSEASSSRAVPRPNSAMPKWLKLPGKR